MDPIQVDIDDISKKLGVLGVVSTSFVLVYKKVIKPMFNQISYLTEMMHKLDRISGELLPNGGSSLRDAVNRIESRQIMSESRWSAFMIDSDSGNWESDENGNCVSWNRTLVNILGKSPEGLNWLGSVKEKERDEVYKEWVEAVKQKREFYKNITYQKENGEETLCVVKAYPLINEKKEVKGWFGIATRIKDNG